MAEYYIFEDEADAFLALSQAEEGMRDLAELMGFIVNRDGNLVGQNAADGTPADPSKQPTEHWADVEELPDGRWGFPSFRNFLAREENGVPLWKHIDAVMGPTFTVENLTFIQSD